MSRPGASPAAAAFAGLEEAVGRAIGRVRELEDELRAAEVRRRELEALLKRFTADDAEPSRMLDHLRRLEAENGEMRSRLEDGRAAVERLLARIRFLEEKR